MDARAALIAAVAVTLSGCAADGSSGGGADMAASAHDMGLALDMGACSIVQLTVEKDPNTGLPKTTVPALITATVSNAQGIVNPMWTVSRAGDSTGYTPMFPDSSHLTATFQADLPGSWTFVLTFDKGPCPGMASVTLAAPMANSVVYRLRALPPESKGLPLTDTVVTVYGNTPLKKDIALQPGTLVTAQLKSGGVPVAGQVRFLAKKGPDAVAVTMGQNLLFSTHLLENGAYTPLIIPESGALAPHLGSETDTALLVGADYSVGGGATVSGSVTDPAAANLAGVRAVLRDGVLPSSAGTSNAGGAFALHAEPRTYSLSFGSDAWPEGTLDGVVVPAGGASIGIHYTIARTAVGGSVVLSDGTTPVAGARVTIASHALGPVADVTVGANTTPANGRVLRVVSTDAGGALPAMQLPASTYDIIVEPPQPSTDGLTAFTRVVGGSPSTWTLQLEPPITLSGTITGEAGQPAAGARVTAVELVGLGAAPATTTDAAGHYSLKVDAGAPIGLLVEPAGASKLSGTRRFLPARTSSADVVLGSGLLVTGTVRAQNGTQVVPAVTVEALCFDCGSATPLATSITDKDGVYFIYLPDPGLKPNDAGVD